MFSTRGKLYYTKKVAPVAAIREKLGSKFEIFYLGSDAKMKKLISSFWLRCSSALAIGAALSIGGLSAWSRPSPSVPSKPSASDTVSLQDQIANKILSLQESEQRWIQIDLSSQRLIAWEGSNPVYAVIVSTGKRATPTRMGTFAVNTKYPRARMTGPGYDVSNVPHTMYYFRGYAIHGAYWHNKFGTPVSHGCVNVAVNHAKWLYNWATVGTPVVVHD